MKAGLRIVTSTVVGLKKKHSLRASGRHSDCLGVRTGVHAPRDVLIGADPRRVASCAKARGGRILRPVFLIGSNRRRCIRRRPGSQAMEFWCAAVGFPCCSVSIEAFEGAGSGGMVYIDLKGRSK
jgi:hypothetical protein